jgi:hypothetical protein
MIGDKSNGFGAVLVERLRRAVVEADDEAVDLHEHVGGEFWKGSLETAPIRDWHQLRYESN